MLGGDGRARTTGARGTGGGAGRAGRRQSRAHAQPELCPQSPMMMEEELSVQGEGCDATRGDQGWHCACTAGEADAADGGVPCAPPTRTRPRRAFTRRMEAGMGLDKRDEKGQGVGQRGEGTGRGASGHGRAQEDTQEDDSTHTIRTRRTCMRDGQHEHEHEGVAAQDRDEQPLGRRGVHADARQGAPHAGCRAGSACNATLPQGCACHDASGNGQDGGRGAVREGAAASGGSIRRKDKADDVPRRTRSTTRDIILCEPPPSFPGTTISGEIGKEAATTTRGREPAMPAAVGRARESRGDSNTRRGGGAHVGGRGSRAKVGKAEVVYETGRMLVDAVGRVLRRRPGGGDG